MSTDDRPSRFHLAMPVHDLAAAREFYGGVLGCGEGRSADTWVDFDLYGHQFVAHLDANLQPSTLSNPVDGHDVPVPHFGVLLTPNEWARSGRAAAVGWGDVRDRTAHTIRRAGR